jgi:hypothetical protein
VVRSRRLSERAGNAGNGSDAGKANGSGTVDTFRSFSTKRKPWSPPKPRLEPEKSAAPHASMLADHVRNCLCWCSLIFSVVNMAYGGHFIRFCYHSFACSSNRDRLPPVGFVLGGLYRSSRVRRGQANQGKKRHILVDMRGLLLHAIVHSAGVQDFDGWKNHNRNALAFLKLASIRTKAMQSLIKSPDGNTASIAS